MAMHTSTPHKPLSPNNPAAEGKRKRQSDWSSYQSGKVSTTQTVISISH